MNEWLNKWMKENQVTFHSCRNSDSQCIHMLFKNNNKCGWSIHQNWEFSDAKFSYIWLISFSFEYDLSKQINMTNPLYHVWLLVNLIFFVCSQSPIQLNNKCTHILPILTLWCIRCINQNAFMMVFRFKLLSMHKDIHKILCDVQPGAIISAKLTNTETLQLSQLFF